MDVAAIAPYFLAFVCVLAFAALGVFLARRRGGGLGDASRRLQFVEAMRLGGRHRVVLVRCDTVEHVIVLSPRGATLVDSAAMVPEQIASP